MLTKLHLSLALGSSREGDGQAHPPDWHPAPPLFSNATGLVPVKQQCGGNRSQSHGPGACVCSAAAPGSVSCWGCRSPPQTGYPEGSLPTHPPHPLPEAMSLQWHSTASNFHPRPFTAWRTAARRGGGRKTVALPCALGYGKPPQLPRHLGRGKMVRVAWLDPSGTVGWGCWKRCRRTSSPPHATPWKHQHRGFPKSLPFLRLKHLPTLGLLSPEGSSGRWCLPVSFKGLSRGSLVAWKYPPVGRSWGSFLTQAHQVSCAPHPQLLLCSKEQMLHRNCTKTHLRAGDGLW